MNNQSANAAAPSRTTVRVPTASGDDLEAWLVYQGGVSFDDVLRVELEFLHRHAKTPSRS